MPEDVHDLIVEAVEQEPPRDGVAYGHSPTILSPSPQVRGDEKKKSDLLTYYERHENECDKITEESRSLIQQRPVGSRRQRRRPVSRKASFFENGSPIAK